MKDNFSGKNSTTELFKMLQESPERFAKLIREGKIFDKTMTLADFLNELLGKRNISISEVVTGSVLNKSFVYQIFNGERNPGRDILIRIAFTMHLTLEETQQLLRLGEKGTLYPRVRRDAAIICCLEQEISLDEADAFLHSISERGLL